MIHRDYFLRGSVPLLVGGIGETKDELILAGSGISERGDRSHSHCQSREDADDDIDLRRIDLHRIR